MNHHNKYYIFLSSFYTLHGFENEDAIINESEFGLCWVLTRAGVAVCTFLIIAFFSKMVKK